MSEVRLVVRDGQRDIHANEHGSFAESVIAALSAEPETIEELDAALGRFIARGERGYFATFLEGADDEPYDAGIVVVDLAARLVVCDSRYCSAAPEGPVAYHNGECATDLNVNYHLFADWLLSDDATNWRPVADQRRQERLANPPLDVREVVYGDPLLRFIVEQCFEAFRDQGAAAEPDYEEPAYQRECNMVRHIHARWMMTERDDLRGQTPRQAMMCRRDFVSDSLQDREFQWSLTLECPPGLNRQSAAYRFAGFGTHEMVVYYDLVRELVWCCRYHIAELQDEIKGTDASSEKFLTAEIRRLEQWREAWLDASYVESGGRTARAIIHNERARIPEGETGRHAMIDCDCPLCEMQAELPGPVFWHLDGCHMDDDFAFSLSHGTHEEWEQEKREQEDFDRRFSAKEAEYKRLGVKYPGEGYGDPDYVWESSFSAPQSGDEPLPMRLFAIGAHLGELIVDLKEPTLEGCSEQSPEVEVQSDLNDRLMGVFRALSEAVRSPDPAKTEPLVRFVLVDFCDALDAVRNARPDLALKCVDLRNRLGRFLEPPAEANEAPDPFEDDCLPS